MNNNRNSFLTARSVLRRMLALVLCLTSIMITDATVAVPWPVEQIQPDGSRLMVRICGDEFFHYRTDEQGNLLSRGSDGYYHYLNYDAAGKPVLKERVAAGPHHTMRASELPAALRHGAQERRAAARSMVGTSSPMGRLRSAQAESRELVVLVEFSDRSFSMSNPAEAFSRMLNERNYSSNGGTGSVRDYYYDNSAGGFDPHFVVMGPYKLSHPVSYYGENKDGNDIRPVDMVSEAISAAYEDGLNPGDFDSDGDGVLDRFFVYFAGYSEAEGAQEDNIWPHASTLYYSDVKLGSYRVGRYACSQELRGYAGRQMVGIGTFCHEFAHMLGLPDFYDVDYEESGGEYDALGKLSLMCSGNYLNNGNTPPYLNAEELDILGWFHPFALPEGEVSLKALPARQTYRYDTENQGEYFLFENRQQQGWDRYIPSHGLVIYHVDRSSNMVYRNHTAAQMWNIGEINVYPQHPCMDLVKKSAYDVKTGFFPSVSTQWNRTSAPAALLWSGAPLDIELSDIRESGGIVRFKVGEYHSSEIYLAGQVADKIGNPVAGAELCLSPEAALMTQEQVRKVTSDALGHYVFDNDIAPGQYVLLCQKEGYAPITRRFTLTSGSYFHQLMLLPWADRFFLKTLSWCDDMEMFCGWSDKNYSVGAMWAPEDLESLWQSLGTETDHVCIGELGIYIYSGEPKLTARILVDNREADKMTLPASKVTNSDFTVFDFSDRQVSVKRGQSLKVIIDLEDVKGACYVGMDESPHVVNKGDLVSLEGRPWTSVYDQSDGRIDGNWDIRVDLLRPETLVEVKSLELQLSSLQMTVGDQFMMKVESEPLVGNDNFEWSSSDTKVATVNEMGCVTAVGEGSALITVSANQGALRRQCRVDVTATLGTTVKTQVTQHKFYADWADAGASYWVISYKASNSSQWKTVQSDVSEVVLSHLTPRTTYDFKIEAYASDNHVFDSYSAKYVTENSSTLPMSIHYSAESFAQEGILLLDVNNMPQDATLTWTLDGQEYKADVLKYSGSARQLKASVVLPSGKGTEYIVRRVN